MLEIQLQLPPGSDKALLKDAPELVALRKGQLLSIRAVRRSVERLFATGRFADVVVLSEQLPGGARLIFQVTPKRYFSTITVQGAQVLTPALVQAAAKVGKGEEYYAERVEKAVEAVKDAYRARGYRSVRVRSEVNDVGDGLELVLQIEEGQPTRIEGLAVAGGPGVPLNDLERALGLKVGDVLNLDKLDDGLEKLRALYRQRGHHRARVHEPQYRFEGERATVLLPIAAGPRYSIHFHGNRSFSDSMLNGVVAYDGSETLDRALTLRMSRRIAEFYRFKGYHDVKVRPEERLSPNGQEAVLAFVIEEGRPLYVREIVFAGNQAIATKELRQLVTDFVRANEPVPVGDVHPTDDPLSLEGRVREPERASPRDAEVTTLFVESAYRDAAEAMTQVYRQRGYLSARVTLAGISIDIEGKAATVRFTVEEGPRTITQEVRQTGVPEGFSMPLGAGLQVDVGRPFNYPALEADRAVWLRALGRRGYLFARVDPSVELSADQTAARVAVAVDSGPQVRVGKVVIQGLRRTREAIVRDTMKLKEGDVLDPEALFDSQRDLALLGIFRAIGVRLLNPDTPEVHKDVLVELKEMPLMSGDVGVGYFLAEGPRTFFDAEYPNAGGSAVNLSLRAKLNYVGASAQVLTNEVDTADQGFFDLFGGRLNLAAANRGVLPFNIGARVDLIGERIYRPGVPFVDTAGRTTTRFDRFIRYAAVPGVDWSRPVALPFVNFARLKAGLALQYEVEYVNVARTTRPGQVPLLSRADEERSRFPVGTFGLHTLRLSPTLDLRDDPANPSRGLLVTLSVERTADFLNQSRDPSPIDTLKLSSGITVYAPIYRRWVLALSARAGRIFLLDPAAVSFGPRRYYLGGASSMRGFGEDRLLPADTRATLRQESRDCRALASPAGCSGGAVALQSGLELPSEGGELFNLGKAELRFPIFSPLDVGLFFEAGNLWRRASNYQFGELRYVAGAGLRYATPIGPLALDVGVNLFPDIAVNEPRANVHFNVGLF